MESEGGKGGEGLPAKVRRLEMADKSPPLPDRSKERAHTRALLGR